MPYQLVRLFTLCFCMTAMTAINAEEITLAINGFVIDQDTQQPIDNVTIVTRINGITLQTKTIQTGKFKLPITTPGTYMIQANAVGYVTSSSLRIDVTTAFDTESIIIELIPQLVLPEMIVEANRLPDQVAKTVISGHELEQIPGSMGDPLKALQALPGFASAGDFSGDPAIRGSRPDDNLYYVDDLPIGYLFHAGGFVSVFHSDLIEDFTLFASAFGPEYGNGIGAVLDVALREPTSTKLSSQLSLSLLGGEFLVESPLDEDQAFFLAVRRSWIDLALGTVENKDRGITIELPEYYDYQGKYVWDINENATFNFYLSGANDKIAFIVEEDADIVKQEPELLGGVQFESAYNTQVAVLETALTDDLTNKLAIGRLGFTPQNSRIGIDGVLNIESTKFYLRDRVHYRFSAEHDLYFGGNYDYDRVDLNIDLNNPTCTEFEPDCDFSSAPRRKVVDTVTTNTLEAYLKDRWQFHPQWRLIPGLHATYENLLKKSYLEPRLSLEWSLNEATLFSAGWGKYNQMPQGRETNDTFGNPNLTHIKSTHYVAGITHHFPDQWMLKLETYYKTFRDFVVSHPVLNYDNDATGRAYGLEILLKKSRTTHWNGWLALTGAKSNRTNNRTGETFAFEFDQPIIATIVGTYQISPQWTLGFKWQFHSGQPYTPVIATIPDRNNPGRVLPLYAKINSARLPNYHRLDIRIDYDTTFKSGDWKLNTYFEIINVYNQKNIANYHYNADYTEQQSTQQLPFIPSFGIQVEF